MQPLLSNAKLGYLNDLINFWLAKGGQLAAAGAFVQACIESAPSWQAAWSFRTVEQVDEFLQHIRDNSARAFLIQAATSESTFINQFSVGKSRLETLALFIVTAARATVEVTHYPPLYTTDSTRFEFQQLLTRACEKLIELCLSLDCLNDLQLLLQLEHFVLLSNVSGDQS
jgi:hypothetical protein